MLALTYPDGARVQRCDYLPESPPISPLIYDRIILKKNEPISTKTNGNCKIEYASRFRRRLLRRGSSSRRKEILEYRENDEKSYRDQESTTTSSSSSSSVLPIRCEEVYDNRRFGFDEKPRKDHGYKFRVSSQYRTSNYDPEEEEEEEEEEEDVDRLSILDVEEKSFDTRRRELPGRESWPGGSHPKDHRCFLRIVLILVLVILGTNRHCGPFGSRVNRVALGAFVIGNVVVGRVGSAPLDISTDTGVRSERSANLSHITGTSRKIYMYFKNRHLQILPDGTVNGSNDDPSDYTILQRSSVSTGQLRIQGVATCLYLCMDSCGILYGSREHTKECFFKETMGADAYNTYSSVRWSTPKQTVYLGLDGRGRPRTVRPKGNLRHLSAYARVLTPTVPQERVEALQRRMMGAQHNVRHHHGSQQTICPAFTPQERDGRDKFRCRKRKKRKKRRRKCKAGEIPGPQCVIRDNNSPGGTEPGSKRSCEGAAVDEACRREALDASAKKRKSRIDEETVMDKDDLDEVQEEDLGVEKKSRRSNDQRGSKKKGKKTGIQTGNKKNGGGKKKKNGNGNNAKGEKNLTKITRRKSGNRSSGRFPRTTYRLTSSTPSTSPLSWFTETTSSTIFQISPVSEPTENHPTSSELFTDHPKSLSSSSSAVSLAATGLASTLTLAVAASAEVFSEDGTRTESSLDLEEIVDVKDFDDEEDEEDEREDDDEEREETKTDFSESLAIPKIRTDDQKLAM